MRVQRAWEVAAKPTGRGWPPWQERRRHRPTLPLDALSGHRGQRIESPGERQECIARFDQMLDQGALERGRRRASPVIPTPARAIAPLACPS